MALADVVLDSVVSTRYRSRLTFTTAMGRRVAYIEGLGGVASLAAALPLTGEVVGGAGGCLLRGLDRGRRVGCLLLRCILRLRRSGDRLGVLLVPECASIGRRTVAHLCDGELRVGLRVCHVEVEASVVRRDAKPLD
ncbi:hypothetical protein Tdes44962_MAKER02509 [Teratosphaeria destructans]|uniref:Uncharacterized protein n=1 Tax=Teratosphaeria destructans TaxID=418781 RepID=A0A9W7STC3_9PEZI|nr:hypothetical protein Tdes44962_MAKER02509 [Teratosphaeria destructans]